MKRDETEILATAVFAILAGILIGVLSVFATGYAGSIFWNMAMPDLFGLPTATVRNGIGLAGLALCAKWMIGSGVSFTKE
jgi:hypothetical protein